MATNSTGMNPPRPPPPSARDTTKESAARPARRTSNRPPGKSVLRSAQSSDRHAVDASLWESAPARTPGLAVQNAPPNMREIRDELVRALMPELRTLVEHLVTVATDRSVAPASSRDIDAALARSLAPLLERQRTLEAAVVELQRNPPAAKSAAGAAQHLPERTISPVDVQVDTQAWITSSTNGPPVDTAISRKLPAPRVAPTLGTQAFDTTPWADIPAELNGSRRKRIVLWLLAIGLFALLGTAVGLSVMSNAGAQF
jgi:hypothetical protein